MKKILFALMLVIAGSVLTGCASALKVDKTVEMKVPEVFEVQEEPDIEFIGFKADANTLSTSNTGYYPSEFDFWKMSKNDTSLKKLGSVLESSNIAFDQSFAYFGIYSLQELELYKSKKRYVTFIEVDKHKLFGTETGASSVLWGTSVMSLGSIFVTIGGCASAPGWVVTGIITTLGSIPIFLIPRKTTLTFNGEYQIFVYDTKEKKVVYKTPLTVSHTDTFKGSYTNKATDKTEIYNYYGTLVYNELLQKYDEVFKFMKSHDVEE